MSSAPMSVSPSSDPLPYGWVVGWSRSANRQFWARAPTDRTPELKQWMPPTPEQWKEAEETETRKRKQMQPPTSDGDHLSHLRVKEPSFIAWKPPSAAAVESAEASVKAAAAEFEARRRHEQEVRADEIEQREAVRRERDELDEQERRQHRKRRVGLGFENGESEKEEHPHARQKTGKLTFVPAGASDTDKEKAIAETAESTEAAVAAAAASAVPLPPSTPAPTIRLESASRPVCTVNNPPIYESALDALQALSIQPASPPTQWSDPKRYAEVMEVSKAILLNTIYGTTNHPELMEEYLSPHTELPEPPKGVEEEEDPRVINARRAAFNELDTYLTHLCNEFGLRAQPIMSFLRWGFNQRSLQKKWEFSESSDEDATIEHDPLLPMDAQIDSCLVHELVRERMRKSDAEEVCIRLADKCRGKARELGRLKKRLGKSPSSSSTSSSSSLSSSSSYTSSLPASFLPPRFTLLSPAESHQHSFHSSHPESSSLAYRAGDLLTHSQAERDQYKLIYDFRGPNEYAIPLNSHRYEKLRSDYIRTTGPIRSDVNSDQIFLRRLWSMLARYDTISGSGYQAALPEAAFDLLRDHFGVRHECYASPLNHHLDSFGSAFWDTDRWFGSKGSFLDQRPTEGGFQANPPFLEEVMAPMAMHVLALLERAQKMGSPLCFVVIWPGWDDTPAYDLLMTSRFMRHLIVFEKNDHYYTEGLQHRVTVQHLKYRLSKARSFAFWMQTDAAAEKWPCKKETLESFKKAFMTKPY